MSHCHHQQGIAPTIWGCQRRAAAEKRQTPHDDPLHRRWYIIYNNMLCIITSPQAELVQQSRNVWRYVDVKNNWASSVLLHVDHLTRMEGVWFWKCLKHLTLTKLWNVIWQAPPPPTSSHAHSGGTYYHIINMRTITLMADDAACYHLLLQHDGNQLKCWKTKRAKRMQHVQISCSV